MSRKQQEHNKNYHLEDLNEIEDTKDTNDTKDSYEILKNTIWEDLSDYRKRLSIYDPEIIKTFIERHLKADVIEIRKNFNIEFRNVPNDDELKREVMILLGQLGITIYRDNSNDLSYLG